VYADSVFARRRYVAGISGSARQRRSMMQWRDPSIAAWIRTCAADTAATQDLAAARIVRKARRAAKPFVGYSDLTSDILIVLDHRLRFSLRFTVRCLPAASAAAPPATTPTHLESALPARTDGELAPAGLGRDSSG